MHLAIDAVGAKHGGAATVLIDVLNAAIDNPRVAKITLFCSPAEKRSFDLPSSAKLIEAPRPWIEENYALRILWYEWFLGYECLRIGADVLFAFGNFGRGRFGLPHVTLVQQSMPFSREGLAIYKIKIARIKISAYRWQMKRSCQSAARTICQSSVMKDALVEAFCLDPSTVAPVYPSPRELKPSADEELDRNRLDQRSSKGCLLYVGIDTPYKKVNTLVEGLKLIQQQFPDAEAILTLPQDHAFSAVPGIRCVGYLDDSGLIKAYKGADALVLPSVAETVGMPTLEAMSLGTPVLVADRPYAHDVCENAALFFDPNSPADFSEKAIRLLTDEALRQSLIARGFKLVEKRRAGLPYKKIIDICVNVAMESRPKRTF